MKPRLLCAALPLALAGCALAPDGRTPDMPHPAHYGVAATPPATVSAQGVAQRLIPGGGAVAQWWRGYGSPELDAWVDEGLANSPDLAAADRSLAAAREQLRAQVGESMLPSVDAGAQANRQRQLGLPVFESPTALYNTFVGQVRAQYTFDLFGASRYANAALAARVDQQALRLEASRRALAANIVTTAITAAALREQVELTQRQATLAREVARDARRRFELGSASQQEALDADQNANDIAAGLPGLRSRWQATRHALAVLLGRTPDQAPPDLAYARLQVPADIPVSVPSQLLAQRPDILAADAALKGAAAEVGARTAQMLPQLSLSASMGRGGFDWGRALSGAGGGIWAIGASLTQPLFHGGALMAERRAAQQEYEGAAAQYRQTVLSAFRNVADSLAALEADNEALAAAEAARRAAEGSWRNTARRVELGALPGYQGRAAELHYVQARVAELRYSSDRLGATAALFHAMGTTQPPTPPSGPLRPAPARATASPA
ncbi:efflux transporter outer membrane subunit [Bordetella hinzii]|uniref:efflux transporter outer membrane subunit n=1 Tax=Bordetella hinzii TaxID=103855 RepID=UPI00045B63BF|nr:efflux transporter outer membrane subunit [Bordetella hinzii]KCB45089.1 efflux transporter, outer membrane factor lipoprotein, NodT family [Bordetella hinzii 4161]KXA73294.1 RND transporter [Bordetella hinzii LMG 13501]QDJ37205.1 RND transporter [Bordetella hinzii]VEH26033.1 outer membrane exporter protein [Bordetella hinzii]